MTEFEKHMLDEMKKQTKLLEKIAKNTEDIQFNTDPR